MNIVIPIAIADVFDKVSILEIKLELVEDDVKQQQVRNELSKIKHILGKHGLLYYLESDDYLELKKVNRDLWDICDHRRQMELNNDFGDIFIQQSRAEYKTNDLRFFVKNKINKKFDSEIKEVKSYSYF